MRKVRGIGINDTEIAGPACTKRDIHGKKQNYLDYRIWYGMLIRTTDGQYKTSSPSYAECSIFEDWLLRSNFQKWYLGHEVLYDNAGNLLELDKDILVPGNKEYGPNTCALIPQYLNVAFNNGIRKIDGLPMWVSYRKSNKGMKNDLKKPYRASLTKENGKYIHLGYYTTPEEAHLIAQKQKISFLKDILKRYEDERCFRQDVYNSVLERISLIEDAISNGEYTLSV